MCSGLANQRIQTISLQRTTSVDEEWVIRLKSHLLAQYEEYLIRKLRFNEAIPRGRQDPCQRRPYSLMYKSIYGGAIILVEVRLSSINSTVLLRPTHKGIPESFFQLLFRGAYFSVRVAAVEHQRLFWRLARGSTPRETRLAFVDETDRLCHLSHVSSFVQDFHLMCVAEHIISDSLEPLMMTSSER